MKASESNAHYASRVRESSNFAVREIKKVSKEIGPRMSGSENEKKAQEYLGNLMTNFSDDVKTQEFSASPKAYLHRLTVCGSMMILSAVFMIIALFNFIPAASVIFKSVAVVLTVLSIVIFACKGALTFIFPKAQSSNVICTRKPSGDVKRRIIVGGHIDSTYEERLNLTLLSKIITAAFIVSAVVDIASFFELGKVVNIVLAVVCIITIPAFILMIIAINKKVMVLGAKCNLTGVFASMAALKYLNDNDIRFENTEFVAVSTGCGEAGNNGAKALANAYKDGVETVFLAVNTLSDFDRLGVSQKLNPEMTEMVKKSAETAEYTLIQSESLLGAEASVMNKCGIKSAALTAIDAGAEYYHTSDDTAEKLDMKTMEAGVKIILETAFLFDEKGIK